MSETPDSFENGLEANRPPNERIIFNQFDQILNGRGYEELGRREDDEGPVNCELATMDEGGDRLAMEYSRGKIARGGERLESRITQVLYTPTGIPCGAGTQYDHIGGKWTEARANTY